MKYILTVFFFFCICYNTNGQEVDGGDFSGPVLNVASNKNGLIAVTVEDINRLIKTAPDSAIIYFPRGVYQIDRSIEVGRSNIELLGDSGKTIFKIIGDNFIPLFIQGERKIDSGFPEVLHDVVIKGLSINANGYGRSNAGVIMCNGVRNYLIINNVVFNSPPLVNGIAISQPGSKGIIRSNVVYNCGKGGIYAATYSDSCIIDGNIVHDISNGGLGRKVLLRQNGVNSKLRMNTFAVPGIQVIGGINTTVVNNTVYSCSGSGIYCITGGRFKGDKLIDVPLNCKIKDNICRDNDRYGVEFGNSFGLNNFLASRTNGLVDNNLLYGNRLGGIFVKNRRGIQITRNAIYNNGGNGSLGEGVYLMNSDSLTVSMNIIYDNNFAGIYLNNVSNASISDNRLYESTKEQTYGMVFKGGKSKRLRIVNNVARECRVPVLNRNLAVDTEWKDNVF